MTVLLATVVVEKAEVALEKIELELEVKVGWLEAIAGVFEMVVCGWVDTAVEWQEMAGESEVRGKSVSSSEGILQIGWWAAKMNSSLSFSFSKLAISFCRLDFSSSSLSVSCNREK